MLCLLCRIVAQLGMKGLGSGVDADCISRVGSWVRECGSCNGLECIHYSILRRMKRKRKTVQLRTLLRISCVYVCVCVCVNKAN